MSGRHARLPMHGRDHCPGGSDPIPCMCDCSNSSTPACTAVVEELSEATMLLGYWPLGETSGDFADGSGQAQPATGTVDTETVALTRGTSGPSGTSLAGVTFNASNGANSDFIATASGGDGDRFNINTATDDMSIAALIKPTASASGFSGNIVGQMTSSLEGWRLYVAWPTRQPTFHRRQGSAGTSFELVGPALPADTWTFVVATYNETSGFAMYYNGVLVASDATTFGGLPNHNLDPRIGRGGIGHADLLTTFYGTSSEVSVWEGTLTPEQITLLVSCAGTLSAPESPARPIVELKVFDDATNATTGNGKLIWCVPEEWNGANLVNAQGFVSSVSSSGAVNVMIRNVTQTADMLSTAITIDASEFTSYTAATPSVVDTGNDDVATGDLIAVDVDGAGTNAKGLGVILTLELPS